MCRSIIQTKCLLATAVIYCMISPPLSGVMKTVP